MCGGASFPRRPRGGASCGRAARPQGRREARLRAAGSLRVAGRPKTAASEELATAWEDSRPAHAREGSQRPVFRGLGGVSCGSGGVSCGLGGLRGRREPATWGNAASGPRRRATRGGGSSQTANYGPSGGSSCVRRGASRRRVCGRMIITALLPCRSTLRCHSVPRCAGASFRSRPIRGNAIMTTRIAGGLL